MQCSQCLVKSFAAALAATAESLTLTTNQGAKEGETRKESGSGEHGEEEDEEKQ